MIKRKSVILKCRHESKRECQEHIDKITSTNKSRIIDSGIGSDDEGHYSWIKVKEWVNE